MTQVPDVPLGGLYGDAVLDHLPHTLSHRAPVPSPDVQAEEFNPLLRRPGLPGP